MEIVDSTESPPCDSTPETIEQAYFECQKNIHCGNSLSSNYVWYQKIRSTFQIYKKMCVTAYKICNWYDDCID